MTDTRAKTLLDQIRKHEASEPIDHAAVERLLGELQALDEDEVSSAAGLEVEVLERARVAGSPGRWRNWPRNRESERVRFEAPGTLADLIAFVQAAANARGRIKPLGAGYSCSEASQPQNGGIALDTLSKLDHVLPLDHVRAGISTSKLVRVEAGIRLQELAVQLAQRGLALPNLGGFTKQTLAGVMSTATHGTGLTHSSFSDIVVSVDIVCVDANHQAAVHRFEPRGGITDPATFPNARTLLHQDDNAFHAMVVSCGMLGIVYAYTVQVIDLYFVRETHERFVFPDDFPNALRRAQALENISVTLHPYSTLPGGKHLGILTHFERLDKARVDAIDPKLWSNPPVRPVEKEFMGVLAKIFGTAMLGWFMAHTPRIVLKQIEKWFEQQPGQSFLSVYYNTFPRMTGDRFRGTFSESSLPLEDLQAAVTQAFAHAQAVRSRYHYLVPFALRFIKASRHLLSMHYGRDSGTLEAFVIKGVPLADEALRDLEALLPMGRPHWGQMHWFQRPVQQHYPDSWGPWLNYYRRYNATGLFNSPITDRLKIST